MVKRMTSVEFRVGLPKVEETTEVTLRGRRIGVFIPEGELPDEWTRMVPGKKTYTADITPGEVTKR